MKRAFSPFPLPSFHYIKTTKGKGKKIMKVNSWFSYALCVVAFAYITNERKRVRE
jgi:hypothetical protein